MALRDLVAPLAASLLVALPASAAAPADWRLPPGTRAVYADVQAPYFEARRVAYDRGYREGQDEGEKDARRGDRFAFQDERDFQRADRGYNRSFGDRERYRQFFRDGYAAGYRDGYARYDRSGYYGRPGYGSGPAYGRGPAYGGPSYGGGSYGRYPGAGYYSPAFDNGARDGYEKGVEDARRNRSFDPLRHSWYRGGDRHYEGRYGPREQYRHVYRQGFQQGYEQGFREARYRY